jgi:hypothetical protein
VTRRKTHHSPGCGGEDLSHGPGILVGEEVDGGQGPIDYHSQDKDDHQADLNIIISILIGKNEKCCTLYYSNAEIY